MFGYACNETPELMPTPVMFAHRLGRELTAVRKGGKSEAGSAPMRSRRCPIRYVDGKPTEVANVVISTQHTPMSRHRRIENS